MDYIESEKSSNSSKVIVLKDILSKSAEDSITDEQMLRILKPVLQMINAGFFDKPYKSYISKLRNLVRYIVSIVY